MLSDPLSPHSQAIFAAAKELDVIRALSYRPTFDLSEADLPISKLIRLSESNFDDPEFIQTWLRRLGESLKMIRENDPESRPAFEQAMYELDSIRGFGTVYI